MEKLRILKRKPLLGRGLRALLIHKGTKQKKLFRRRFYSLRALLIHKGTKLVQGLSHSRLCLRALLIHKGTKL